METANRVVIIGKIELRFIVHLKQGNAQSGGSSDIGVIYIIKHLASKQLLAPSSKHRRIKYSKILCGFWQKMTNETCCLTDSKVILFTKSVNAIGQ